MNSNKSNFGSNVLYLIISIFTGLIVGLLYLGFEWLVSNGSNWLWNDLVKSDVYRWRVIPLAILMSIVLTLVIKLFNKKRVTNPNTNLINELSNIKKTSLLDILAILAIGAISLIAGASLGPEASLVAATMGIAAWISSKINALNRPFAFQLSLAGLGALLAAFFNSLIPIFIPILILKKKNMLSFSSLLISIFAGFTSWAIVKIIKNEAYISIPIDNNFKLSNILIAFVLGLLSVLLSVIIKSVIKAFMPIAKNIDGKNYWLIGAIIFGLVLGLFYFIGGQTVQFSGSEGVKLISDNPTKYGIGALAGLIVIKLFATSWSASTGYRGGFVFPSIYMGVVLSLLISAIFNLTGSSEAGTLIGSITGILMGMTSPILGTVLAIALFPISQFIVLLGAILGSLIGHKITLKKFTITDD